MVPKKKHEHTPVTLPIYTQKINTPEGIQEVEYTPFNKEDCKLLHDAVDEMLVCLYRKRMRLEETMGWMRQMQSVDTLRKREAEHAALQEQINKFTQLSKTLLAD